MQLHRYQGDTDQELEKLAKQATVMRKQIIDMISLTKSAHMGCGLSIADILTVVYGKFIDIELVKQQSASRDYFFLSKGHAASALYSILSLHGIIPKELLNTYCQNGSPLLGHPVRNAFPGVEASTGSLGHGLAMAVGVALAAKQDKLNNQIYVLVGDGESEEGSIWEAVIVATRFQLDNLTIIVDYNNLQGYSKVEELVPGGFYEKFKGFGCDTVEVSGHNHRKLITALSRKTKNKPKAIIAHTIKGYGISSIQGSFECHYKCLTPEQLTAAHQELGE